MASKPLHTPRTAQRKAVTSTMDTFWSRSRGMTVDPAMPLEVFSDASAVDAVEILRQIHSGEKSAVAVMTACLGRIAKANGKVNACVEVADQAALLEAAAAVDAKVRNGEALLPLDGLPMLVKLNSKYRCTTRMRCLLAAVPFAAFKSLTRSCRSQSIRLACSRPRPPRR